MAILVVDAINRMGNGRAVGGFTAFGLLMLLLLRSTYQAFIIATAIVTLRRGQDEPTVWYLGGFENDLYE